MDYCFRKLAVRTARLLPVCQLATGNPVPNDLWIKWAETAGNGRIARFTSPCRILDVKV